MFDECIKTTVHLLQSDQFKILEGQTKPSRLYTEMLTKMLTQMLHKVFLVLKGSKSTNHSLDVDL